MWKSSPWPSGPASLFSFPPSSFDGSLKPGLPVGQSCWWQPRRFHFYSWVWWRIGRIASSLKPSPRSFYLHRQCLRPGLAEPLLLGGLRPVKNHPIRLRSNYHTRQIGSATVTVDGHCALTLTAAYRILQFRAAPREWHYRTGSIYANPGHRENLAQRKVDQLGRRQAARPFSRGQLRLRGLRRHPLLRNQAGPGDLPLARAHAAPDQFRENLPHGASLLRRSVRRHRMRIGPSEQIEFLLRQAHRAARLRRSGSESAEFADRYLHGLLELGRLSWPRSPLERRRGRSQLLDPHRPQHPSRHVQGRRKLHELAAHSHGSDVQRLHRRYRPRYRWPRQ